MPAKIQLSLHTTIVLSESSLGTFLIASGAKFLHVGNKDWLDYTFLLDAFHLWNKCSLYQNNWCMKLPYLPYVLGHLIYLP